MKKHEIFWAVGIIIAMIGAAGADSESLIPIWIIMAGVIISVIGFIIRDQKCRC